ncbi:heparinase II/III family protein, partial [bacterium]|nr:heparinase II/III family protein [bacterium]
MSGRTFLLMAVLGAASVLHAGEPIAASLPEKPEAFGKPISDRALWETLAKAPAYAKVVEGAESLAKAPIPDSPDSLYLDYSKTGNRTRWQRVASQRRGRINAFVLAECIENKGRFLPHVEAAIVAVCAERTWVMPAHDRSLVDFHKKAVNIDLGAAHLASNLAMCRYLLGDRLSAETRTLIRDNLQRRTFKPYLDMVAGTRKKNWWMTTTNNWNTVCLAGVTAAALATVESREERALFVQAAMDHSKNFLKGFPPDGYCTEGLGYWNYGFGYFVVLSEALHQATGGQVDLLAKKEAQMPAQFSRRIHIMGDVYPSFADCGVGTRPSGRLSHFLARRLQLGARAEDDASLVSASGDLAVALMYSLPNSATATAEAPDATADAPLRNWFDHAGILVSRPGKTACRLGVALKGGHNAEHHNHNDVGSYVVVVDQEPVLLDPGSEVYTARTFSGRRYESNVLNSFGHPVPKVAGTLQRTGRAAKGAVVSTDFTDAVDTLVLDIKSAYAVKELTSLRRTFVYSRQGDGTLTVKDEVAFTEPRAFETALVTLGRWKPLSPTSLLVFDFEQAVRVDV